MSDSQPVPPEAEVAAGLRAAGCVFAEDEARLLLANAATPAELARNIARRIAGFPLEHILGWVDFCGVRVSVSSGVFVPRRRTEFLVHQAVAHTAPGAVVLDLCCGCGALGMALHAALAGIRLYAADIDPAALRCARDNLAPIGGTVFGGDLFEALPPELRGRIDTLLCNAPYVPTGALRTMPPEARDHEPPASLDGGADGLAVQRRVAEGAAHWLAPGGRIFLETGVDQAERTAALLSSCGLVPRITGSAEFLATVVMAVRPPHGP